MTPLEWLDSLSLRDGTFSELGLDQLAQLDHLMAWIDRGQRTDFGPVEACTALRRFGGYLADSRDVFHMCRGLVRLGVLDVLPRPNGSPYPRYRVLP